MKRPVPFMALGCICLGPQISGSFTGSFTYSALLIVFSFGRCLPVTTVFPLAVRAQPFQNSLGVRVARMLVSSQKRTRCSFANKLTLPPWEVCSHWGLCGDIRLLGFIFGLMFPLDIYHLMVTADSIAFSEWEHFKPLGLRMIVLTNIMTVIAGARLLHTYIHTSF